MIASCTALDLLLILNWRGRLTTAEHVHSYNTAVLLEELLTTALFLELHLWRVSEPNNSDKISFLYLTSPFATSRSSFILSDVKSDNKTREHYFCGPPVNSASQNRSTFLCGSLSARGCSNDWCCGAGKLKGSFSSPLTAVIRTAKIMAAAWDPRLSLGCSMVQLCLQGLPISPQQAISRMMSVQQPISHCSSP